MRHANKPGRSWFIISQNYSLGSGLCIVSIIPCSQANGVARAFATLGAGANSYVVAPLHLKICCQGGPHPHPSLPCYATEPNHLVIFLIVFSLPISHKVLSVVTKLLYVFLFIICPSILMCFSSWYAQSMLMCLNRNMAQEELINIGWDACVTDITYVAHHNFNTNTKSICVTHMYQVWTTTVRLNRVSNSWTFAVILASHSHRFLSIEIYIIQCHSQLAYISKTF